MPGLITRPGDGMKAVSAPKTLLFAGQLVCNGGKLPLEGSALLVGFQNYFCVEGVSRHLIFLKKIHLGLGSLLLIL